MKVVKLMCLVCIMFVSNIRILHATTEILESEQDYVTSYYNNDSSDLLFGYTIEQPVFNDKMQYQNGEWTFFEDALKVERTAAPGFVKLMDGRILIAGGILNTDSAETFDPSTNIWTKTSPMRGIRSIARLVIFDDGTILVAGSGDGPGIQAYRSTSETFDPLTGIWSDAGNLTSAMTNSGAVKLLDGRVLIMGDRHYPCCDSRTTSQIYDSSLRVWSNASSMITARQAVDAVLLDDGRVFVCGSFDITSCCVHHGPIPSAEIYDPSTSSWDSIGDMSSARYMHTVTKLNDGRVLVTGGSNLNSCEIYDPQTNLWQPTASMLDNRSQHKAVVLANGCVVVVGGVDADNLPLNTVELYDPNADEWMELPPLTEPRGSNPVVVALDDGRIMVACGWNGTSNLNSMELLSPCVPVHTVTFDSGVNGMIADGAVQSVSHGSGAVAPDIEAYDGFYFMGWDADFSNITADLTINAISRERFNGKDGIEEPLEILITDELVYISENNEYWNLDVALKGNINSGGLYVIPIGSLNMPFNGEFNGCGYTITSLQLDFCDSPLQGLFGVIGSDGVVKNLGVDGDITATRYINFDSGIIAGQNQGIISCCHTSGNVAGYITAGGIAGYNVGTINDCYSFADCTAYFAAGLIGENSGNISNCYTTTTITSIDNGIASGCQLLDSEVPSILETFGWDTVDNSDDGLLDIWYQNNEQLPMLYWQTIKGDCNNDGIIDDSDFQIITFSWLSENSESERQLGDINLDGIVDLEDFSILSRQWFAE